MTVPLPAAAHPVDVRRAPRHHGSHHQTGALCGSDGLHPLPRPHRDRLRALNGMSKSLLLSAAQFGFASWVSFNGYVLLEMSANLARNPATEIWETHDDPLVQRSGPLLRRSHRRFRRRQRNVGAAGPGWTPSIRTPEGQVAVVIGEMLLGHVQVALANTLKGDNPFSDACLIAMDYGREKSSRATGSPSSTTANSTTSSPACSISTRSNQAVSPSCRTGWRAKRRWSPAPDQGSMATEPGFGPRR